MEGLRPIKEKKDSKEIGFERRDGVFKAFGKEALKDKTDKPSVFIIPVPTEFLSTSERNLPITLSPSLDPL